jgi:hypothetical protein
MKEKYILFRLAAGIGALCVRLLLSALWLISAMTRIIVGMAHRIR